jgi:PAS domain-containing protein
MTLAPLIDAPGAASGTPVDAQAVASVTPIDAHAVVAAALDGLSDGVLVVAHGVVLVANGAAHRLAGCTGSPAAPRASWPAVPRPPGSGRPRPAAARSMSRSRAATDADGT